MQKRRVYATERPHNIISHMLSRKIAMNFHMHKYILVYDVRKLLVKVLEEALR